MKKIIIEIEQLATLLFNDDEYNKFVNLLYSKRYQAARLMVDDQIEIYENFNINVIERLEDLLIDLIIEEMDGEEFTEKQVIKNTG